MRREEKIELILKHLGNNGWKITTDQHDKIYTRKGTISPHLNGTFIIGSKIILKDKDYIYIDNDDSIGYDGDNWEAKVTLYANGSGYLVIPILYHTITEKKRNKINFASRDYYVDLSHINSEEEIADVIAQLEEKINQVKFKVKEYESKIREQKMKKDF
ncbi:MAG: hypothetical protein J6V44_13930 [Methanobrevibacter sp.]|nr:hypothetical protein [Methanobrevibacter sp.]